MSHKKQNTRIRQKTAKPRSATPVLRAIREAVANYMGSEGCSCCQGSDHVEHEATLAKILRVKPYDDKSGFDFARYATKKP